MTTRVPVQCNACARWLGKGKCQAFSSGIPEDIQYYGADHRRGFAGDRGIHFQLKDGSEAREALNDWKSVFSA